jgi:hypothetical protein
MKDLTDPLFLTGTTIHYDGNVRASHDINDLSIIKSKDYMNHFKLLGYPEYVLDALKNEIPAEILSQEIQEEIGMGGKNNMSQIVQKLIKIQKQSIAGEVSDKYWEKAIEIVSSLIKENAETYRAPLMKIFLDFGIMSYNALNIFNALLEDVTKGEGETIIDSTKKTLDNMQELVASGYKLEPASVETMNKILSDREGFMRKVRDAVK